jgi:tetratricopeptide (TPR) repeat protein
MLGNNEEAMKSLEKAASIEPNNSAAWVAKSSLYNYLGQVDNAADDIEKSLSLEPNNAQIQKTAIALFLRSRNPDRVRRANELLDNGLQADPLDGELRMLKARILLAKQTAPAIEQAKNIIQSVTKDQPEVVDAWVLLADITLRQGNTSEALDIIVRGLARKPNSRALLMLKARAEMERTPTLAIATLTTLREIDPNNVGAAIFLSSAYGAVGQPQKAVSILETQLSGCKINADVKTIRIALAAALYKNGDTAKSQEMFDVLYQSSPDDPNILFGEVRLLKDNKLWSQIAAKAKSWNESHKNDRVTQIAIAGQLAGSNDSEAKKVAEDMLQKALADNPENVEAMSVLGVLMHTDGRFAEAQSLYQRILKVQPDNLVILNNAAWILCEEQGKYQQALELSQQGLKIAPDYVDLIDTRGVAYYRLGEFDKAVQDFKKCIELYPARVPAAAASRFHLGRAMVKLGQKEETLAILKKAIELNSDSAGLSPKDMAEARQLVEKLSQSAVQPVAK